MLQLINATIEDVALKEDCGYKAIEGMLDRWIETQVNWKKIQRLRRLGLDEIALKKGHRDYVVIVTGRLAPGEVVVIAVLPDRQKETIRALLEAMPRRLKRGWKSVCTDLYEGFAPAVQQMLPQVRWVVDRFPGARL